MLLHGYARNGAADHVESQVLQRFEADAILEGPAVCSTIRYGPMSSFLPLFLNKKGGSALNGLLPKSSGVKNNSTQGMRDVLKR